MVKVGDRVNLKIELGNGFSQAPPEPGTVVYVHPERRYCTVEFVFWRDGERRAFRESYPIANRITCPPWEVE